METNRRPACHFGAEDGAGYGGPAAGTHHGTCQADGLELFAAVEQQRDGSVVRERDLHVRTKVARDRGNA